jgi:hypothetical protein
MTGKNVTVVLDPGGKVTRVERSTTTTTTD